MTESADRGDADPACPFCAIVAGHDKPPAVVYRWSDAIAFAPLRPATRGHTLLIPARHYSDIWDLDESLTGMLLVRIQCIAKAMRLSLPLAGLNIINSAGSVATQSICHVHFHILPRYEGDKMGLEWPASACCSDAEILADASVIRERLVERES